MAKATTPASAICLQRGFVAERIHDGDDQRALLVAGKFGRARPANLQHHVGVLARVVADKRARRFVVGVGYARAHARRPRATLTSAPSACKLLNGLRRPTNARFGSDPTSRAMAIRIPVSRYTNPTYAASSEIPLNAKMRKQSTKATVLDVREPVTKPGIAPANGDDEDRHAMNQCPITPPTARPKTHIDHEQDADKGEMDEALVGVFMRRIVVASGAGVFDGAVSAIADDLRRSVVQPGRS